MSDSYRALISDLERMWSDADRRQARQGAFGTESCPNGPSEEGEWPCDPVIAYGGGWAECSVCGRTGKWPYDA